ncbi:MAG: 23S rRNA (adenine(2503)-C(2))-methyltransferase RlmN [Actinobacteria bacterium]|nr:23S rRNA (adenine(2503)-C(2))-methyltransferase RlmN [Actinomycetota bacterium]
MSIENTAPETVPADATEAAVRPRPGELQMAAPRRPKPPRHLADLTAGERRDAVAALGEKPFRAKQLSVHYFDRLVADPAQMSDLPAASRERLVGDLLPSLLSPVRVLECDGGATVKTVWKLFDGALVESVLMRYPQRATVCVSSQAGCGMNCPFCATGQAGLTRNMSTAEIVEQVVSAARGLAHGAPSGPADGVPDAGAFPGATTAATLGLGDESGEDDDEDGGTPAERALRRARVSNVVFMGMGEPLANYRAVVGAVRRLTDPRPDGLGMSARGVTVSTVGLVPAIERLAGEGLPVTLALSLHAPDDDLRDELVPINTRFSVAAALDAAYGYFRATGRRVSIEYALIRDVNDHAWRADRLGTLLNPRGRGWVHVNPIPLNPTPGSRWTASDPRVQDEFVARLRAHGVPTTVRDTRGREIDGACGQLAATAG